MKQYEQSDYDEICKWHRDRELMSPKRKDLPSFGLIEPGIAAGFLVQTDSSVAILDFYIANPNVGRKKRNAALDEITKGLMARAEWLGFKAISAMSKLAAIENRAKNNGMKFGGYFYSFMREL